MELVGGGHEEQEEEGASASCWSDGETVDCSSAKC
jgi:hypothetical protein